MIVGHHRVGFRVHLVVLGSTWFNGNDRWRLLHLLCESEVSDLLARRRQERERVISLEDSEDAPDYPRRIPHDEAYLEEALSHEQTMMTDRENLTEMTAAIRRGTAQERRDTFVKANPMPGKQMRPKVKAESAADGGDQKTKLVGSRKR